MNKRIKELIDQMDRAGLPYCAGDNSMTVTDRDLAYFAELIVEECASICYNSGMQDSDAHAQNLLYEFNIHNCRGDK